MILMFNFDIQMLFQNYVIWGKGLFFSQFLTFFYGCKTSWI
jgi:hypothetical protein